MRPGVRWALILALALALVACHGTAAQAQWGYPGGFGMCGWGGQANTPEQRAIYQEVVPKLVALRTEAEPIPAETRPHQVEAAAVADFFSKMNYKDLQKKAPAPAGAAAEAK
jgi:hypothetical protein